MGGRHTGRDTQTALTAIDRFGFPATRIPMPAATHILGTALRSDHGGTP